MRSKRGKYGIGCCDNGKPCCFSTRQELISHVRRYHPNLGIELWNALGTSGDAFADTTVKHFEGRLIIAYSDESQLRKLSDENKILKHELEHCKIFIELLRLVNESNITKAIEIMLRRV